MIHPLLRVLKVLNAPRFVIQLQWETEGIWIGALWKKSFNCYHIRICPIPMLILHCTYLYRTELRGKP